MIVAVTIMLRMLPTMATTPSQKAAAHCHGRVAPFARPPDITTATIPRIRPRIGSRNAPSTPMIDRMNAVIVLPDAPERESAVGGVCRSSGEAVDEAVPVAIACFAPSAVVVVVFRSVGPAGGRSAAGGSGR